MAIKYFDQTLINKKVDIVNSNKEVFKIMGLKPQVVDMNSMYLNNNGNPVLTGSDHCGADLILDIILILEIMQNDYDKTCFSSINVTSALDDIKNRLKRNKELFKNSNDILDFDVGEYINRRANIFMAPLFYSRYIRGVYNEWAMLIINALKESKYNIYNFMYQIMLKSNDVKETMSNLLKTFGILKKLNINDDSYLNIRFLANDILIQLIGFDKIETQLSKTITTSKIKIYEEFFNYMIMGYNVVQIPKVIFDEKNNSFKVIKPHEFTSQGMEREIEEEIKLIKKLVPLDERHNYFID